MIIWMIAGLLALATGMRIGWALVNRQSVVSGAMIVALGGLTALAAVNWPPLTRLIDTGLGRPNIAVGLSQVALIAAAAGSLVMISTVVSDRPAAAARRRAGVQYGMAAVVAAVSLALFMAAEPLPEMSPRDYLDRNPAGIGWLAPLLYVAMAMALASWIGIRLANPTRRGRAVLLFSCGTALIVAATAVLLTRTAGPPSDKAGWVPVGTSAVLLLSALAVVAAGALLPAVEDWLGSRRELRLIEPLERELERRHPDVGIGIRPRGPLVFRVAERLSVISDALYLEAISAESVDSDARGPDVSPVEQARAVAGWIAAGPGDRTAFPGHQWLRQPASYSDRDWILEIARRYRECAPPRDGG